MTATVYKFRDYEPRPRRAAPVQPADIIILPVATNIKSLRLRRQRKNLAKAFLKPTVI